MKTVIFKPFERYSEKTLLVAGTIAALAGILLAWMFGARFDGVLDLHYTRKQPFWVVAGDQLLNGISLLLFLIPVTKWINRKTRIIDVVNAFLISRIPLYFLTFGNVGAILSNAGEKMKTAALQQQAISLNGMEWTFLIVFGLLAILMIVWSVTLLYNGYKVASNAKGARPIILFVLSLLFAEIVSKVLIFWLLP